MIGKATDLFPFLFFELFQLMLRMPLEAAPQLARVAGAEDVSGFL